LLITTSMRNAFLLSLLAALTACQAPPGPEAITSGRELAGDYRIPVRSGLGRSTRSITIGDGPNDEQVLFINFDGATLTRASNNGSEASDDAALNRTWIPNVVSVGSSFAYPSFDSVPYGPTYDDAFVRGRIVSLVSGWYAPYNVLVTTTRPASGRYTMMMVGGQAGSFISPAGSAVGVAPLDCDNESQSNIGFAFATSLSPGNSDASKQRAMRLVAQTIAHEAGHSFGLEHVDSNGAQLDVMVPAVDPDVTGFLMGNQPLSDGVAACGTGSMTDSDQRLRGNLGPAPTGTTTAKPSVTWLAPRAGDIVPRQFTVAVSATQAAPATITRIEIVQDGQLLATLAAAPYQETFQIPAAVPNGAEIELTAIAYNSAGAIASAQTQFVVQSNSTQGPIGCLVDVDCDAPQTCQAGICAEPSVEEPEEPPATPDLGGTPSDNPSSPDEPAGPAAQDDSGCSAAGGRRPGLLPTALVFVALLAGLRRRRPAASRGLSPRWR